MKRFSTLLFVLAFAGLGLQAQDIIWGGPNDPDGNFSNGLGNWTTVPISVAGGMLDSARWTWTPDGEFTNAAFWGNGSETPIASESGGGAVGFNSDYLDNGGDGAVLGDGPAVGPQVSYLVSPVIDCSGESEVWLSFYSSYRVFQSSTYISISSDGGMSYDTTFFINGLDEPGESAVLTLDAIQQRIALDISAVAANQDDVVVRFEWGDASSPQFSGYYYYWMIDDVALTTRPANELDLISSFHPSVNGYTPSCLLNYDTFGFFADVINRGTEDQTNVTAVVNVLQSVAGPDQVIHTDTINFGTLAPNDTASFDFNTFVPEGFAEGEYFVQYLTFSDSADFATFNNRNYFHQGQFIVDNSRLSKSLDPRGITSGTSPAGSPAVWAIGNAFSIPEYDCEVAPGQGIQFMMDSVTFCAFGSDNQPSTVIVWVLRVADDIAANYSNFDNTSFITDNPGLEFVHQTSFTFPTTDDQGFATVPVFFEFSNDPIELVPGERYWIILEFTDINGSDDIFACVDNKRDMPGISTVVWNGGTNQWFLGGFGPGTEADITASLMVEVITNTNEVTLPENTLNLFPNPVVNDQLTVEIGFDQPTDGSFIIYDAKGRVQSMLDQKGMTKQQLQLDTYTYPAGNYFLRLDTDEGSLTKKFVIQR